MPKRDLRLAGAMLTTGLAALVAGVAHGTALDDTATAAPGPPVGCADSSALPEVPTVSIEDAPAAELDLIRSAAERVGTTLVKAARLSDPPDPEFTPLPGYPGDRWLYIEVRLADSHSCRVEQDWQAARLAGAVRNAAATAALPIPFGYTIIGVFPDGSRSEPISITIGAPIGTEPAALPDRAAEAARVRRAVADSGLELRRLAFAGADGAAVIRTRTAGKAEDIVRAWPDVIRRLVSERADSAWLVEIEGPDGRPIKAIANSPSTAGTNGWSRPDLRILDLKLAHDE